jgi:hypothetical protein
MNTKTDNVLLEEAYNQIYNNLLSEAKKSKKNYDGDGKVESPEEEYKGVKDKAIKHNKGKKKKSSAKHLKEATEALLEAVKHFAKKKEKDAAHAHKKKKHMGNTTGTGTGSGD